MIVEPSTTWLFSDSPLYAATVRVVRLLAAAIDHRVSPGRTVCGTAAWAGAAMDISTASTGSTRRARTFGPPWMARVAGAILARLDTPMNACARCYDASQATLQARDGALRGHTPRSWTPPISSSGRRSG